MPIGKGFNRFMCFKSQSAFGTKATGLTQTMVPLRSGGLFSPNPLVTPRDDSYSLLPPASHYYENPKILPWGGTFLLVNPTSASTTLREFFKALFGKEVTAVGPPLTKTYSLFDELIDGGTDTATDFYGRGLTLHEQCDDSTGTPVYVDEVEDAVISRASITWTPTGPVQVAMSGMASNWTPGVAPDASPAYPDGSLFTFKHVKDTATAGLRIGTPNPPTASNNVVFSQAVLNIEQDIRYEPWLGIGTKQVNHPTRNGDVSITLDVTMDVATAVAGQWTAADAATAYANNTGVNAHFLSYIDVNNIFEFKASAATAACKVEKVQRLAQSKGAMQFQVTLRIAPAALADLLLKFTTPS